MHGRPRRERRTTTASAWRDDGFGAVRQPSPQPTEDDSAIIERVREGDRDAFGELVARHLPRALALARRILHHREDAEDLVQDAFLRALEKIDYFEAGRPFWPWLSRILVNRGLDIDAARSIRRTEELPDDVFDERDSPMLLLERREIRERFERALIALPPRSRLVVQLFELDGYSVSEIAEMLESSPATIRWHLHVTRRQLRQALSFLREGGGEGTNELP